MNNVIHNILVLFALISLLHCGINIIRKERHVDCNHLCASLLQLVSGPNLNVLTQFWDVTAVRQRQCDVACYYCS